MKDLERCDREIREIQERPDVVAGNAPAWLVALGINDWTVERSLILRQSNSPVQFVLSSVDPSEDIDFTPGE